MNASPIKVLEQDLAHRPGTPEAIPSLTRCQVSTPRSIVDLLWTFVQQRRSSVSTVLDLGAGDGRFALANNYTQYLGVEIDPRRVEGLKLPDGANIQIGCAFDISGSYDVVVGNPPYIRNQDLSAEWRSKAHRRIADALGICPDGRSNAYLYFFWLALALAKPDGLCALVVPLDWVWRPSAATLRSFLAEKGWPAAVYELPDTLARFGDVRTSATISVVDRRPSASTAAALNQRQREWRTLHYYSEQHLPRSLEKGNVFASRGFSTGSQPVFVIKESDRRQAGIKRSECLPCITSLRGLSANTLDIDREIFETRYVQQDRRCWLLQTDRNLSESVMRWLDQSPASVRINSTCGKRNPWYRYPAPPTPELLYGSGFRGDRPIFALNTAQVRAVGAVHGIFGLTSPDIQRQLLDYLCCFEFTSRVGTYHGGLQKLDVGQMNWLLTNFLTKAK